MQNPEFDVRQVSLASEDRLFLDLASPFLSDGKDCISSYRIRHVIPCGSKMAYAIYEVDHSILPVQFCLCDEIHTFGDDESTQFMSLDEIRLMRELDEVVIDDIHYSIESMSLHIVDKVGRCQHMIIFGLKNKN